MGAPTSEQTDIDELNRRLDRLYEQIEVIHLVLLEEVLNRGRKPKLASMFPFTPLERLIRFCLDRFERAVDRLVRSIIR